MARQQTQGRKSRTARQTRKSTTGLSNQAGGLGWPSWLRRKPKPAPAQPVDVEEKTPLATQVQTKRGTLTRRIRGGFSRLFSRGETKKARNARTDAVQATNTNKANQQHRPLADFLTQNRLTSVNIDKSIIQKYISNNKNSTHKIQKQVGIEGITPNEDIMTELAKHNIKPMRYDVSVLHNISQSKELTELTNLINKHKMNNTYIYIYTNHNNSEFLYNPNNSSDTNTTSNTVLIIGEQPAANS